GLFRFRIRPDSDRALVHGKFRIRSKLEGALHGLRIIDISSMNARRRLESNVGRDQVIQARVVGVYMISVGHMQNDRNPELLTGLDCIDRKATLSRNDPVAASLTGSERSHAEKRQESQSHRQRVLPLHIPITFRSKYRAGCTINTNGPYSTLLLDPTSAGHDVALIEDRGLAGSYGGVRRLQKKPSLPPPLPHPHCRAPRPPVPLLSSSPPP